MEKFHDLKCSRLYRNLCFIITCMLLSLTVLSPSYADTAPFTAGQEYQIIPQTGNTPTNDPIRVIEFFSYGCPWCANLEPTLEKWLKDKPDNVKFQRVPVVFNSKWTVYAKAYYIAQALGVEKEFTPAIFTALHDQNATIDTEEQMKNFFVQQGNNGDDFSNLYNGSPTIDAELANGQRLMTQYVVNGIPSFVVAGKYQTNSMMNNGDAEQMMAVVNYLIQLTSTPTDARDSAKGPIKSSDE